MRWTICAILVSGACASVVYSQPAARLEASLQVIRAGDGSVSYWRSFNLFLNRDMGNSYLISPSGVEVEPGSYVDVLGEWITWFGPEGPYPTFDAMIAATVGQWVLRSPQGDYQLMVTQSGLTSSDLRIASFNPMLPNGAFLPPSATLSMTLSPGLPITTSRFTVDDALPPFFQRQNDGGSGEVLTRTLNVTEGLFNIFASFTRNRLPDEVLQVTFSHNIPGGFSFPPASATGMRLTSRVEARNVHVGNPICNDIDFNNDGSFFDPQDIDAFLSVYSEGPCVPESNTCDDIDFNNDTSLFDPCDIDSFLTVFSEGPCTACGA